jgi:hypothetical protein
MQAKTSTIRPNAAVTVKDARHLMDALRARAGQSLLFLSHLQFVMGSTWHAGAANPTSTFTTSIAVQAGGGGRRVVCEDKDWKKFSVSSLFGGSNVTNRMHLMNIVHQEAAEGAKGAGGKELMSPPPPVVDTWVVSSSIGAGRTR